MILCEICVTVPQSGLQPGREFRAAREAADAADAQIVLGDRPIEVSLQRAWAALGLRRRLQLLGGLAQVHELQNVYSIIFCDRGTLQRAWVALGFCRWLQLVGELPQGPDLHFCLGYQVLCGT